MINIGNEDMQVTAATNNQGGGQTLMVVRGYLESTSVSSGSGGAATHASGSAILKVTSIATPVSVTMAPGTYIMAGGGFYVCGNGSVSGPHVLIFNTNDPSQPTGNGALGQVELFTLGSVTLGPQTGRLYGGLTIFQDHSHMVDTTDSCDQKSMSAGGPMGGGSASSKWDIALVAMASTGANGAFGSISGSIYATASSLAGNPGTNRDDFGDAVSGTTTLAVMSDCIFIDGANSTFNFDTSSGQLFGLSATLSG